MYLPDIQSPQISMAPKLVIRTMLKAMTVLTENTIKDGLPYFLIAFCTTSNPRSDATKHIIAMMRAVSMCSMPNNTYCKADMVEEKKTMKEHVAAVTYTTK